MRIIILLNWAFPEDMITHHGQLSFGKGWGSLNRKFEGMGILDLKFRQGTDKSLFLKSPNMLLKTT